MATLYPKALRYTFTFLDFADLAEGLGADALGSAAPQTQARLAEVVRTVAARRGVNPPLEPVRADIVDPFRRQDEVFVQMAQQVTASMPAVATALAL